MISNTISVKPQSVRNEALLVLIVSVLIVLLLAAYVGVTRNSEVEPGLLDWQISAFYDLESADQAIYNALTIAGDEIYYIQYYITGDWPNIEDLEGELLPPFYKDLSWEQNGKMNWSYQDVAQYGEKQGLTLYLGNAGSLEGQGAFLLVIGHIHAGGAGMSNQVTIWRHEDPDEEMPSSGKPNTLILLGWRQVVPYSGRDEVKRLKGTNA
jgi:hypothetical protein